MAPLHLTDSIVEQARTDLRQLEIYDSGFSGRGSFGLRVTRGGSKVFFLVYRQQGRRRRLTLGSYPSVSVEVARERALRVSAEVEAGVDPRAGRDLLSFKESAALYLEHHVFRNLKSSTAEEYRRIFENELNPKWGALAVTSISQQDISHLLARISLIRGRSTLATRVRAVIGSFFSFAMTNGLVLENPVPETPRPKTERVSDRVLSMSELLELLAALDRFDSLEAEALRFLIYTGQNSGEIMSMSWSDLRVDSWYVGGIAQHPIHEIPFPAPLLERIHILKTRTGFSDFVFGISETKHIAHIGRFIRKLNRLLAFEQPFSPRDIRRSFQIRMRELGVRPDVIEKIQGRQSSLPPRLRPFSDYDYSAEIRSAFMLWADRLTPSGGRLTTRIDRITTPRISRFDADFADQNGKVSGSEPPSGEKKSEAEKRATTQGRTKQKGGAKILQLFPKK